MQPDDKVEVVCTCGKRYRVDVARAGKRARCKVCGETMLIPEPEPVVELTDADAYDAEHAEGVSGVDPEADGLAGLASAFDGPAGRADDQRPSRRRRREPNRSWLDKQFAETHIAVIIIVALFGCCSCVVLPFSLVGLIACKDPVAKRNAAILFFAHMLWLLIGIAANVARMRNV